MSCCCQIFLDSAPSSVTLASTDPPSAFSSSHRRRVSIQRNSQVLLSARPEEIPPDSNQTGRSSLSADLGGIGPEPMSLSRSPSPRRAGGWSSPGLNTPYDGSSRQSSPARSYVSGSPNNVTWKSAQVKSAQVRGHASFSPRTNDNFFKKHGRRFSAKLPRFNFGDYSDKEKLGRGRWAMAASNWRQSGTILTLLGRMLWKQRLRVTLVLVLGILIYTIFSREYPWRRVDNAAANRTQHWFTIIIEHLVLEAETSLSLCLLQTWAVESQSGKDLGNGLLSVTVSRTRRSTRGNGATSLRS